MFGHDKQDYNDDNDDNSVAVSIIPPAPVDDTTATPQDLSAELSLPAPASDAPVADVPATDAPAAEAEVGSEHVESLPDFSATPEVPAPTPDAELSGSSVDVSAGGDLSSLNSLKQDALHELSPLIGHLDQTPDEKYATAKMVYEETNDQNLLSAVYEAAKNLTDDKAKAEAIYDVIQKINAAK